MGEALADRRRPVRRRSATGVAGPAGARAAVSSSAYDRLRELIVSGRLAPGAPLVETDLSARLGVSRTPVRAVLQRLHQEGFVGGVAAGRMTRAIVSPLTAADMREVFLMTGALEAAAARLAAGMSADRRKALAGEMAELNAGLLAATSVRPPELARAQDLHGRLHRAVAAVAGPRLAAELDVLQPQAERYERVYASATLHSFAEALAEHEAIADAIRSGDEGAAGEAVSAHWRASARRFENVLTILGERGNW